MNSETKIKNAIHEYLDMHEIEYRDYDNEVIFVEDLHECPVNRIVLRIKPENEGFSIVASSFLTDLICCETDRPALRSKTLEYINCINTVMENGCYFSVYGDSKVQSFIYTDTNHKAPAYKTIDRVLNKQRIAWSTFGEGFLTIGGNEQVPVSEVVDSAFAWMKDK